MTSKVWSISGLVVLVLVLGWLSWRTLEQGEVTGWNQWVDRVQIASQPGSTEKTVRRMLCKPDFIARPEEAVRGVTPPAEPPAGTVRVLGYSRLQLLPGATYWVAHVFVSKSGRVLGCHIGNS